MSQKPNAEWLPLIYSTLLLVLFFSFSKLAKDGWHTLTIHVKKDFLLFLSLDFLLVSLPLENKKKYFFHMCISPHLLQTAHYQSPDSSRTADQLANKLRSYYRNQTAALSSSSKITKCRQLYLHKENQQDISHLKINLLMS